MLKLISLIMLTLLTNLQGLITHITTFEINKQGQHKLVVVCGDYHKLGSWEDNVTQFLGFVELAKERNIKIQFLVENLSSSNDYFNRPQDLEILEEKQAYIFNNLTKNYTNPRPIEMPTVLHFFGCSNRFFTKLTTFLNKPQYSASYLANLPVVNVDNRHRNVYYGESLVGWSFGPYNTEKVRAIQDYESKKLTLLNLLAPQERLKGFCANSSGWIQNIFDEILARQEAEKRKLFQNLQSLFNIKEKEIATTPIASLAKDRQQELYRYLQKSPLENILREMIEANSLWLITKSKADVFIVLAGTNHTGHTEGNWVHQTPGLTKYLGWTGFKKTFESHPNQSDLVKNKITSALRLRFEVPCQIAQLIKNFSAEKRLRSAHVDQKA